MLIVLSLVLAIAAALVKVLIGATVAGNALFYILAVFAIILFGIYLFRKEAGEDNIYNEC